MAFKLTGFISIRVLKTTFEKISTSDLINNETYSCRINPFLIEEISELKIIKSGDINYSYGIIYMASGKKHILVYEEYIKLLRHINTENKKS